MKKAIAVIGMLLTADAAYANLIETTLLDHVATVTQFKSGETKLGLVDSVVKIGSKEGKSILDLQAGFNAETKPQPGEVSGANLTAGAFLKVSSLAGDKINFPDHWEFLRGLEHGPFVHYDFREKNWFGGYQVGLAFNVQPIQ